MNQLETKNNVFFIVSIHAALAGTQLLAGIGQSANHSWYSPRTWPAISQHLPALNQPDSHSIRVHVVWIPKIQIPWLHVRGCIKSGIIVCSRQENRHLWIASEIFFELLCQECVCVVRRTHVFKGFRDVISGESWRQRAVSAGFSITVYSCLINVPCQQGIIPNGLHKTLHLQPGWLFCYSLSNVIPVNEKFCSFHQYLRYCHKSVTIVFSIPDAILWA